jgi:phosphoserine aminotransferase
VDTGYWSKKVIAEAQRYGNVRVVADMSSNILSEQIDVSQFGLIYAGAQKNIASAGLTVVIIREDLIGNTFEYTPTMLNYKTHAEKNSLFNTPPCFCIYMALLVFRWIQERGGLSSIEAQNREKAALLYDYIDNSRLFLRTAEPLDRSIINVTFIIEDENLTAPFLQQAEKQNLISQKGHRSVGGLPTSMYNAMPVEGVKKLIDFIKEFEKACR